MRVGTFVMVTAYLLESVIDRIAYITCITGFATSISTRDIKGGWYGSYNRIKIINNWKFWMYCQKYG